MAVTLSIKLIAGRAFRYAQRKHTILIFLAVGRIFELFTDCMSV